MPRNISLSFLALMLVHGCAASPDLPLGHWSGFGSFAYEKFEPSDEGKDGSEPVSEHGDYTTTLRIARDRLNERDVIKLDVETYRDELPGMGDRTIINMALVESKSAGEHTKLYRVVAQQINPDRGEELVWDESAPPLGASCTARDGVTTCIVEYMDNFVDVYRFSGDTVEKHGSYFKQGEGMIHWNEILRARN